MFGHCKETAGGLDVPQFLTGLCQCHHVCAQDRPRRDPHKYFKYCTYCILFICVLPDSVCYMLLLKDNGLIKFKNGNVTGKTQILNVD